jgi:hypothetical protein
MLYPYTDNYLDSVEIGRREKQDTNARIQRRLAGIRITPRSNREEMINRLVGMIEGEFDRDLHPLVYDSLLGIHSAQCRSVEQQSGNHGLSPDELFDISIEKGGTSVLADGCLVSGTAGREDLEFFFQFGVLLQLIDDLQDVQEDLSNNQRTMVGLMAQAGTIDEYTNRLLAFIATVLDSAPFKQERLRQLIERSCRLLVLEAAACNPCNFSQPYLIELEHQSPVQFDYLRAVKKRVREKYDNHPRRPAYVLGWVG